MYSNKLSNTLQTVVKLSHKWLHWLMLLQTQIGMHLFAEIICWGLIIWCILHNNHYVAPFGCFSKRSVVDLWSVAIKALPVKYYHRAKSSGSTCCQVGNSVCTLFKQPFRLLGALLRTAPSSPKHFFVTSTHQGTNSEVSFNLFFKSPSLMYKIHHKVSLFRESICLDAEHWSKQ